MKLLIASVIILLSYPGLGQTTLNVRTFGGAASDGQTDDTPAIQKTIDAVGETGYNRLNAMVTVTDESAQNASVVALDEENFITVDGERFFPYGFYIDRGGNYRRTQQQVKAIGEAGFNIVQVEPVQNARIANVFDEAERQGMKVLYSPTKRDGPNSLGSLIDEIKDEPSLLGYTVGDDVQDGKMEGRPANVREVGAFSESIQAQDPDHLTFVAIGGGGTSTIYNERYWDIGSQQIYPVNGGSPLRLVYETIRENVVNSARLGQCPVGLLQSFRPTDNPAQRFPTPAEFRNMLYQALVAGTKGILYYSYDNFGNGIEFNPPLLTAAQATTQEIKVLEPFLVSGSWQLEELDDNLWMARWEKGDELLAIVVYPGDYQSLADPQQNDFDTRSFSWKLPDGYRNSAPEDVFSAYPSATTNQNGTVAGSIRLLDVQVVKFSKETVSPPAAEPTDGLYELHPVSAPTKVLEVNPAQGNGDNVQQATDRNTARQRWRLNKLANGYYRLTSGAEATQCLDVRKRGTSPGTNVQTWRCNPNGQANQEWKITLEDEGLGHYRVAPRHTEEQGLNRSLDVARASQADGANLQLWNSNGTKAQRFVLEKVGEANARSAANELARTETEDGPASVRVYPNPSRGSFTVEGIRTEGSRINLYDLQGRSIPVRQQIVNQRQLRIQARGAVSEGLYILRVQTAEGVTAQYRLSVQPSATKRTY